MPPEVRYADSDGVAIAYQVIGEGPAQLVLVPGFVWHLEVIWEEPAAARFFGRLASFARVVLYDKREQGLSDRLGRAPTLEESADDLRAVLDATATPRTALLGVSEGGPMAMLFAALHPERCSRLILYGTYARLARAADFPIGVPPEALDRFVGRLVAGWGGPVGIDIFSPSVAADERARAWWARLLRMGTSPTGMRGLLELYNDIDVRGVLHTVQQPTLVLHRAGDRIARVDQARLLADAIPDARLVELEGEDHLFVSGDTSAILDEVEEFLTGTRQPAPSDRVLATVLFTDLVDSTARAAQLGDRRWSDALEAHDVAVRAAVERHRGRVVKTTGDGALALFDGPARGIEAARAAIGAVRALGLDARAGLHTGEVELRGDDVAGLAVHLGARVAALARPGEVLVSRTVADLVAGSGLSFDDRGEHELKGVPGRWRLHAVR